MGQSAWKIAEAKSAAQEKPRENSLQSETAVDALLGQSGETTTSLLSRREDGVDADRISSPVLSPIASLKPPSMAPGVGGFNIDPPAPRASLLKSDVAIAYAPHRALPKPTFVPQPPIQAYRTAIVVESGGSSLVLNLFAITAIVGVIALGFADETRKQVNRILELVRPLYEISNAETSAHRARLVVENQKGFANEPLPLGISVKDASGAETVTVAGLANDAELSLGTSLGAAGWRVPAHDLDKTFVGARGDFVGIMDAMVILRSSGGELLDSQAVRFEWIQEKREDLEPKIGPSEPMNSEQIAALIKLGQDLLKHGDIASARLLLKRAAIEGNAQAAFELGLTFDQPLLAQSGAPGFGPDVGQARGWYERAIKLGSIEASRRLERLSSMPK